LRLGQMDMLLTPRTPFKLHCAPSAERVWRVRKV
jgi:hypothetical protein